MWHKNSFSRFLVTALGLSDSGFWGEVCVHLVFGLEVDALSNSAETLLTNCIYHRISGDPLWLRKSRANILVLELTQFNKLNISANSDAYVNWRLFVSTLVDMWTAFLCVMCIVQFGLDCEMSHFQSRLSSFPYQTHAHQRTISSTSRFFWWCWKCWFNLNNNLFKILIIKMESTIKRCVATSSSSLKTAPIAML